MRLRQLLSYPPTPAIVSRQGAKRLPRWALLIIAGAYLLAGFVGRAPWKYNDIASTGVMVGMAQGRVDWWHPLLMGAGPDNQALLPYWLGAWAIQSLSPLLDAVFAARLPFLFMMAGTFTLTWFATYYLALHRSAQPVAFAFGGEATPKAYARAIADGGLLALIAGLGLAQVGHEVGPQGAQIFFASMVFAAIAARPFRVIAPSIGLLMGLVGLALSGAPTIAGILWFGALLVHLSGAASLHSITATETDRASGAPAEGTQWLVSNWVGRLSWFLSGVIALGIGFWVDAFKWNLDWPSLQWDELQRITRLLLWFLWPLWPLVLWTLWQWRRHLTAPHLLWPLAFGGLVLVQLIFTHGADWGLIIGMPAFAALAAFALPTLTRRMSAFVDWLTLLFFSACGLTVWVMWAAMLTGWPEQPAANVRRLVPGFELTFSWPAFGFAVAATVAWILLVRWRISRHRHPIWKSLVLPAGGTVWAWVLLMTLWLPVFDYARSYQPLVANLKAQIGAPAPSCINIDGLNLAQTAALTLHSDWRLVALSTPESCQWLISTPQSMMFWVSSQAQGWDLQATLRRPSDNNEELVILKRNKGP